MMKFEIDPNLCVGHGQCYLGALPMSVATDSAASSTRGAATRPEGAVLLIDDEQD
jgi:hypothetical protein